MAHLGASHNAGTRRNIFAACAAMALTAACSTAPTPPRDPKPTAPPAPHKAGPPKGLTMHRASAGTQDATGWYSARSTKGRFTVLVPAPFNDYTARTSTGGAHGIGGSTASNIQFSILELGQESIVEGKTLKGFAQSFADRGAEVSEERVFEYEGHEAIDFIVAGGPSTCFVRQVVLSDRVYMLMVEGPAERADEARPIAGRCFDSLQLRP